MDTVGCPLPLLAKGPLPVMRHVRRLFPLLAALALAGCRQEPERSGAAGAPQDPVISAALGDELMTDPDLARQNQANAALSGGGPASALIPPEARSAEAVAAARAEAARLAGGVLRRAPAPAASTVAPASEALALTANRALAIGIDRRNCVATLDYAFAWAAKFPAAVPIYPRSHVQEAAGSDADGCRLRIARFASPAPPGDVVDFYWTLAGQAALAPRVRRAGGDQVISGGKGDSAFVAYLRERGGLTEVDLVTNGM